MQQTSDAHDRESRSGSAIWLGFQLADAAFPAGGLAHAGGLEAALAFGQARGRAGIASWIGRSVDAAGELAVPLLVAAWDEPGRWGELDLLCDALLTSAVANRASRAQGQSFLAAAAGAFGDPRIADLRRTALAERRPAHLAPAFGTCLRLLEVPRADAARLHLHGLMRSLVTAAVRLNALGPLEAQALHHSLADRAEAAARRGLDLPLDAAAATDPLLEVVQGCQDRLYSRLFTS